MFPITAKTQKTEPAKLGAMRKLGQSQVNQRDEGGPISQGPPVIQRTALLRLNQGGAQRVPSPQSTLIVGSIRTPEADITFIRSFEAPANR